METPRPCPFCGSEDVDVLSKNHFPYVSCNDCDCRGPDKYDPAEAVDAWNKRAVEGVLVEALEALVAAQKYYEEHADQDGRMPGNDFYSAMFMTVVTQAKAALKLPKGEAQEKDDDH